MIHDKPTGEIIRANMLEVGDRFMLLSNEHKVIKITDEHIIHGLKVIDHKGNERFYHKQKIGKNSRQKVELLK